MESIFSIFLGVLHAWVILTLTSGSRSNFLEHLVLHPADFNQESVQNPALIGAGLASPAPSVMDPVPASMANPVMMTPQSPMPAPMMDPQSSMPPPMMAPQSPMAPLMMAPQSPMAPTPPMAVPAPPMVPTPPVAMAPKQPSTMSGSPVSTIPSPVPSV